MTVSIFKSSLGQWIWAAVWGFFVSMLALTLFGKFDHLDLGYWKGFMLIMVVAVAAWVWWLPMREARRRMRNGGP